MTGNFKQDCSRTSYRPGLEGATGMIAACPQQVSSQQQHYRRQQPHELQQQRAYFVNDWRSLPAAQPDGTQTQHGNQKHHNL